MADDTTQKTPIRVRLNACDISFFEKKLHIKKNIYICACQDSTFWRMYHNINYQTMESKTKFQKSKACKTAFYVILPLSSPVSGKNPFNFSQTIEFGYEIVMCYQKEIAESLAVGCGRVVSYRTMLRFCGNGRPVTFFNFYLS